QDGHALRSQPELEASSADGYDATVRNVCIRDGNALNQCTVGAAEITKTYTILVDGQVKMESRDSRVMQDQLRRFVRANDEALPIGIGAGSLIGSFEHQQVELTDQHLARVGQIAELSGFRRLRLAIGIGRHSCDHSEATKPGQATYPTPAVACVE